VARAHRVERAEIALTTGVLHLIKVAVKLRSASESTSESSALIIRRPTAPASISPAAAAAAAQFGGSGA